jgi:hypothetical protein
MKYHRGVADRFGAIQQRRSLYYDFSPWYSRERRHSRIGLVIAEMIHYRAGE